MCFLLGRSDSGSRVVVVVVAVAPFFHGSSTRAGRTSRLDSDRRPSVAPPPVLFPPIVLGSGGHCHPDHECSAVSYCGRI